MRHLQDAEIFFVAADDLYADREPFRSEAGRDRGGRIACGRDVPAGLHPVDIVRELHAGDLGGVGRVDVERRQLRGGQDEVFVFFEEGLEAAPELAVGDLGARYFHAGQAQALFDLALECVLESVRVVMEPRAVTFAEFKARRTRNEISAGANPVRPARRCSPAIRTFSCGHPLPCARAGRRDSAKVLEPGHADAFKAAVERARENVSRFVDGERGAGIWAGDRAQHVGEVCYRTAETSGSAQRGPREGRFRVWHAAGGGTEADHVAERGGISQRAACVGAADNGREAAGQATAEPPEDPPHVFVKS